MARRREVNAPQGDLFRSPLPPAVPIPPDRPRSASRGGRTPTALRAGTPIDHSPGNAVKIWTRRPTVGDSIPAGYVDRRQRFFQTGGKIGQFVYRERVTFPGDVWRELVSTWADAIDFLEYVDHEQHIVYRIAFADARASGAWYEAGLGPRWGVPEELWEVT